MSESLFFQDLATCAAKTLLLYCLQIGRIGPKNNTKKGEKHVSIYEECAGWGRNG